jgi:hypothetical protein
LCYLEVIPKEKFFCKNIYFGKHFVIEKTSFEYTGEQFETQFLLS